MRALLIIILLIITPFCYAQTKNNIIEIGSTAATFFNGEGFNYIKYDPFHIAMLNLSYTRKINNKYFVRASYFSFAQEINYDKIRNYLVKKGDVIERLLFNYELNFGRFLFPISINPVSKFYFDFGSGLKYQQGEEIIYIGHISNIELRLHGLYYKSLGIGCYGGINYTFYDRVIAGFEANYGYYWNIDVSHPSSSIYNIYPRTRQILTSHFKLGLLF